MSIWVDVDVRVRGLAKCLPADRQFAALGRAHDLKDLCARLGALGLVRPGVAAAGARELDWLLHRRAGAMLRLLSRWSGQRAALLAPIFDDEDCRSVSALLDGIAAGTPLGAHWSVLVSTPALPVRALAELAETRDARCLAARLADLEHPYGEAMLDEARLHFADVFRLKAAAVRAFAARARRASLRSGRAMRTFVERAIDAANVRAALSAADRGAHHATDSLFVEGGHLVPREAFLETLALASRREAAMMLLPFLRDSPLEALVGNDPLPEDRLLRALIREQRDIARLDPLGPAPIIEFVLRIRLTLHVLRRVLTSVAPVTTTAGLVAI